MGRDSRARKRHHRRAGVGRVNYGLPSASDGALYASLARHAADTWPSMVRRISNAAPRRAR